MFDNSNRKRDSSNRGKNIYMFHHFLLVFCNYHTSGVSESSCTETAIILFDLIGASSYAVIF